MGGILSVVSRRNLPPCLQANTGAAGLSTRQLLPPVKDTGGFGPVSLKVLKDRFRCDLVIFAPLVQYCRR